MLDQRLTATRISFTLRLLIILLSITLGSCDFSYAKNKDKYQTITQEEFTALLGIFSKDRCDIEKLRREIINQKLNIEVLDLGNAGERLSLSTLQDDDLCLISLGSSFQTYSENHRNNSSGRFVLAAGKDVFPTAKKIVRVEFFLPQAYTPKSCYEADQTPYPYILKFSKIDGVLTGLIYETDTPSECFFLAIKKKRKSQGKPG
jgi:hypothetical protein